MKLSPEEATRSTDMLIKEIGHLKDRLIEYGYDTNQVKEWHKLLHSTLLEWRSNELKLADVFNATDTDKIPGLLKKYTEGILWLSKPNIEEHLFRLRFILEKVLPEDETDWDDEDSDDIS